MYTGPGGVLTGTARRVQEANEARKASRMEAQIRLKEEEINRLKAVLDAQNRRLKAQTELAQKELEHLKAEKDLADAEKAKWAGMREEGLGFFLDE